MNHVWIVEFKMEGLDEWFPISDNSLMSAVLQTRVFGTRRKARKCASGAVSPIEDFPMKFRAAKYVRED